MAKGIHSRQKKRNNRIKAAQIRDFELQQLQKLSDSFNKNDMDVEDNMELPSLGKEEKISNTEYNQLKKKAKQAEIEQEAKRIQTRLEKSEDYMDNSLVGLDAVKLASNIVKKKNKKKVKKHKGIWRDENRKIGKDKVY